MSPTIRFPPASSGPFREMDDVLLIGSERNVDEALTRKIFRPILVDNQKDSAASVKGTILHQRRRSRTQDWEDTEAIDLRSLKGGEGVWLDLSAGQLYELYQALRRLYAQPIGRKPATNEDELMLVPSGEYLDLSDGLRQLIRQLDGDGQLQLMTLMNEIDADLTETLLLQRQHAARQLAVEDFEKHITAKDWNEKQWQKFLRENTWIFGHNLMYQFVTTLQDESYLGGKGLDRLGGSETDMLMHTEGNAKFVVIADVKRPTTDLMNTTKYRNRAYAISEDLAGGVAQVQSYCRTWVLEGAEQEDNRELLREGNIETYQPRGLLVIGNLADLQDRQVRASFELFRRHLWSPEIITFDELLERAKFTVRLESKQLS